MWWPYHNYLPYFIFSFHKDKKSGNYNVNLFYYFLGVFHALRKDELHIFIFLNADLHLNTYYMFLHIPVILFS